MTWRSFRNCRKRAPPLLSLPHAKIGIRTLHSDPRHQGSNRERLDSRDQARRLRLIVQRDGRRVRLFTRNGHDWSGRFPLITEAALRNRNALRLRRPDERGRRSQAIAATPAEEPSRQDAAVALRRHHPERLRTGRDRSGPVPACLLYGP